MDTVETVIPLREWINDEEGHKYVSENQAKGVDEILLLKKKALLRKTTVAYGIVELLRHAEIVTDHQQQQVGLESISDKSSSNVDNFVVRFRHDRAFERDDRESWNNIIGVGMISAELSAQISEPLFLSSIADKNINDDLGRYLEVSVTPPLLESITIIDFEQGSKGNENYCHSFGKLLYELYSGIPLLPDESVQEQRVPEEKIPDSSPSVSSDEDERLPRKKTTARYGRRSQKSYSILQQKHYTPLQELGFPSSVSDLVQNLIDGHASYTRLEAASKDIHLLLSDPACFLFDLQNPTTQGGNVQLSFRNHKLYGRENQVSLVTDAFCRVSSGGNEAFFIGGFAGIGKTRLVQSLTARVDMSGGYVLTQRVDQAQRERPLSGVISAFNTLCTLIREKNSPQELRDISNKLNQSFESDFLVLTRLLPNVAALSSEQTSTAIIEESGDQMDFPNICFLLQRFMRVVSSELHPVMLILEDLQWCSITPLELIHSILSDKRGCNCFFFVGSYRDNEVNEQHPIFTMISKLDSSKVPTSELTLEGLTPEYLNALISDAMCMFPRLCEPLSNVVFEKTKGNPFYAIEFLRSLVDSGLLKYSLRQKVWNWSVSNISSECITENVLYLLSRKLSSFSHTSQLALKVLSCFGTKVDGAIIEYLSLTPEYSNFREWLDHIISEGCILKVWTSFKFVHDKVQEAAYGLIPDNEKNQFHYNIGTLLYSVSKERDNMGDAIFQIVDQINHGTKSMIEPTMLKDIIVLNFGSGSKAMDRLDYDLALSYFDKAYSLLPEDHWNSNYKFNLRLFLLTAKAAFSCGKIEKSCAILKEIIEEGHCLEEKMEAFYYYVTILTSKGSASSLNDAWTICCEVLSKLNETVPQSVDVKTTRAVVKQTGEMLSGTSLDSLLEKEEIDNHVVYHTLKFYALLLLIAFWKKPQMTSLIACRLIKLSLDYGECNYSLFGFVLWAGMVCDDSNSEKVEHIREACRIGKAAMSLIKINGSSGDHVVKVDLFYYGFVGPFAEPLQECTEKLHKNFEDRMSAGDSTYALYASLLMTKTAIFGGKNLQALLQEMDRHLDVANRFQNNLLLPYLLSWRETVLILIGQPICLNDNAANSLQGMPKSGEVEVQRQQTNFMNVMIQSFWCGYRQRCHHYAKKIMDLEVGGQYIKIYASWLAALNSFRGVKNNNGTGSEFLKVKEAFKNAMSALKSAAEVSRWNFQNKVHLLEAEMFSFERREAKAKASYAAAITSSSASRFVHEEGLSCELAGLHYIKIGKSRTALHFLQRAKECYQQWGSQKKVESIVEQMKKAVSV